MKNKIPLTSPLDKDLLFKGIARLTRASTVLYFPESIKYEPAPTDYEAFFYSLKKRLHELEIRLHALTLTLCDAGMIEGLFDYFKRNPDLPVNSLHLCIRADENADALINALKKFFSIFRQVLPFEIIMHDDNQITTKEDWQKVADFMDDMKNLSISLVLPELFLFTSIQKQIDLAVSRNQTGINKLSLYCETQPGTAPDYITAAIKRTRPRKVNTLAMQGFVDVELQQEKEQQIQIQTSQEVSLQLESEQPDLSNVYGFSLNEIKERFSEFTFNAGIGLVTEVELEKYWHLWQGNIWLTADGSQDRMEITTPLSGTELVYLSKKPFLLSQTAFQRLMNYHHHFQDGLCLDHLPEGFKFIKKLKQDILHYDSQFFSKPDPIAVVLTEETTQSPLSLIVCESIILKLPADATLRLHWDYLIHKTSYPRNEILFFRKYLPQLLLYSEDIIKELLKLDSNSMAYLLENYQKIDNLFQGNSRHSPSNYLAFYTLSTTFQDRKICKNIIKIAHNLILEKPLNDKIHSLFTLFDHDLSLKRDIEYWSKQFSFDNHQLNALLDVYSQYADIGLKKLFTFWTSLNPELLNLILNIAFKKAKTFATMIDDRKMIHAVEILQSFYSHKNPSILTWWWTLLDRHTQFAGCDDLAALVRAFCCFEEKIMNYGLNFYKNPDFKSIKSLPFALGTLLFLLKKCDKEKRGEQWACISEISLSSTGAIRAFLDSSGSINPCNYVIPEMMIFPDTYDTVFGYGFCAKLDTSNYFWHGEYSWINSTEVKRPDKHNPFENLPVISDERVTIARKRFYRFLAHNMHKLPVQFYKDMDRHISETDFTNKEKENLYAGLAKATTGKFGYLRLAPDKAAQAFESLLARLTNLPLPVIALPFKKLARYHVIEDFSSTEDNLIVTLQTLLIFTSVIENLSDLQSRMQMNNMARWIAEDFNKFFANSFQKGTQFLELDLNCKSDDFASFRYVFTAIDLLDVHNSIPHQPGFDFNPDILRMLSKRTEALSLAFFQLDENKLKVCKASAHETRIGTRLLSIMSHFGLANGTKEESRHKAQLIRKSFLAADAISPSADRAMELLSFMDKNSPALTANNLIDFLEIFSKYEAKTWREKDVISIVEEYFEDYFPEGFFSYFNDQSLPPRIRDRLDDLTQTEQNLLKSFLNRFNTPNAIPLHLTILESLLNIGETCTIEERLDLFKILNYPALLNNAKIVDIKALLDGLENPFLRNKFCYFMHKAIIFPWEPQYDLMHKAHIFLFSLLPEIDNIKSQVLSRSERLNFLIQIILGSTIKADFIKILQAIISIADYYQRDKLDPVLEFLHHYITNYSPEHIPLLTKIFRKVQDIDIISSLCFHFRSGQKDNNPRKLYQFLKDEAFQTLHLNHQKVCLNILILLLNDNKACTFSDLKQVIVIAKDKHLFSTLQAIYESPPYPDLKDLLVWLTTNLDEAGILKNYADFDKAPCPRERNNGFDLALAKTITIAGVEFNHDQLTFLYQEVEKARKLSTVEIIDCLRGSLVTNESLVALVAELLHKTKGKKGDSFEINTMQYLSIYLMLKNPHAMSEIATGEGKSRITMILAACRFVQGYTVDIITSDMSLAIRDYLTYKAFLQTLSPNTRLIKQGTAAENYAKDGIHFSDVNQFLLFRNKACAEGKGDLVMNPEPKKRAVIIDEADKFFFDLADKRFNFSASGVNLQTDQAWIYDLLIGFIKESDPVLFTTLYYDDKDGLNREFYAYAARLLHNEPPKLHYLRNIPFSQLEIWQEVALNALELVYEKDFNLVSNVEILTPEGPKITTQAQLIIGKQGDNASKISFGEHQCLHSRLNRLKSGIDKPRSDEKGLFKQLQNCNQDFYIEAEKQIIYSSTVFAFVGDYQEGVLAGLTGTSGSTQEKNELQIRDPRMLFLTIPVFNPPRRKDYPVYLAASETGQFQEIYKEILSSRDKGQPVLVFCEDDMKSRAVTDYLQKQLKQDDSDLIRIHTGLQLHKITKHIEKKAGKSGVVTVSTEMIGRGVHLPVHEAQAQKYGFKVIVTYLPTERNLRQILGRTARFGAEGETRMILNKIRLKQQLGKQTLTDGFYTTDSDEYLKKQQQILEKQTRRQRLIKNALSNFKMSLTKNYFGDFFIHVPLAERENILGPWKQFVQETDILWNLRWSTIQTSLGQHMPDVAVINNELALHREEVQERWESLLLQLTELESPVKYLKQEIASFSLSVDISKQLCDNQINESSLKTAVYEKYDKSHDGKAVLYKRPFIKLEAWKNNECAFFADYYAWLEGRGILFPDFQAYLQGAMKFNAFLFGAYACQENGIASLILKSSLYSMEFFTVFLLAASIFILAPIPVFGQLTLAAMLALSLAIAISAVLFTAIIEFNCSETTSLSADIPLKQSKFAFFESVESVQEDAMENSESEMSSPLVI